MRASIPDMGARAVGGRQCSEWAAVRSLLYRFAPTAVNFLAVVLAMALGSSPVAGADDPLKGAREQEVWLGTLSLAWEEGRVEYVLTVVQDSLAHLELNPRLRNLEGLCLAALGRHPEAVAAYERGLHQSLQLSELHLNLAVSLEAMGATGRAMAEFEEAVRIDENSLEARLGLGRALVRFRRYEAADRELGVAAALGAEDPRVAMARAELAEATGDRASAQEQWQRLEAMDPSARTARRLAELAEEPETRRQWYSVAIERDPQDAEAAAALGALILAKGRPGEAAPLLRQAWEAGALGASALHNLVLAYQQLGDHASLETVVRRSDPGAGPTWGVVALSRRTNGDTSGALQAAERGVELAPEDVELVNLLAVCLDDVGRTEEAIVRWEWILERSPDHAQARTNLEARVR